MKDLSELKNSEKNYLVEIKMLRSKLNMKE